MNGRWGHDLNVDFMEIDVHSADHKLLLWLADEGLLYLRPCIIRAQYCVDRDTGPQLRADLSETSGNLTVASPISLPPLMPDLCLSMSVQLLPPESALTLTKYRSHDWIT